MKLAVEILATVLLLFSASRVQAQDGSSDFWQGRDDTIFTESARTVDFNGQSLAPRFTFLQATNLYDGAGRESDPADQEMRVSVTSLKAVFGLTEDVTVGVVLPFVVKDLEFRQGGERSDLHAAGLGDALLIAKWRFSKKPEPGGTTEWAALLGFELPTGRDDARDDGMRLPPPLQLGSGSLDAVLGAAFTRVWDGGRWLVNADLFYKANSEGDDYRFGNALKADVGLQYRLLPARFEEDFEAFTLNAVLELNAVHAEKDSQDGERVDDTGGFKLFVSPGLQAIVSDSLLFEAGVQIPVWRHLHGPQLGEDLIFTGGLRWRF